MSYEADEMMDLITMWADYAKVCPQCGSRFVEIGYGCPTCEDGAEEVVDYEPVEEEADRE